MIRKIAGSNIIRCCLVFAWSLGVDAFVCSECIMQYSRNVFEGTLHALNSGTHFRYVKLLRRFLQRDVKKFRDLHPECETC
jgi:hypothetical protein